jgi:hypothetical protein
MQHTCDVAHCLNSQKRLQSGSWGSLEALRNQRGLGSRSGASPLGRRLAFLKEPLVRHAPRYATLLVRASYGRRGI